MVMLPVQWYYCNSAQCCCWFGDLVFGSGSAGAFVDAIAGGGVLLLVFVARVGVAASVIANFNFL